MNWLDTANSEKTISSGYYSAAYFTKMEQILRNQTVDREPVLMQVFQKESSILAGMNEAVSILRGLPNGKYLKIMALRDGTPIEPHETVMTIEGDPADFCVAESVYLGVLARSTRVASNMRRICDAAGRKPVLFMGDRFDRFENQASDGEAALLGGAAAICTPAMGYRSFAEAKGTMPHALIACFGGDIQAACLAYHAEFPDEKVTALVDFNNDCVGDSLKALAVLGSDLGAVRLDTSEKMIDKSLQRYVGNDAPGVTKPFRGVNHYLVGTVRKALDENGGKHVNIIVSGGFTAEKIRNFENRGTPVDMYGVGSSIIKNGPDFTADIVKPVGKAGRPFRPNPRLREI